MGLLAMEIQLLDILRVLNLWIASVSLLPALHLTKLYVRKFEQSQVKESSTSVQSTIALLLTLMVFFFLVSLATIIILSQLITGIIPVGTERLIYLSLFSLSISIGVLILTLAFLLASRTRRVS